MQVPDYCSICRVDPLEQGTNQLDGFVTGGHSQYGGNKNAFGFKLVTEEVNCVKQINCNFVNFMPAMLIPRFMH